MFFLKHIKFLGSIVDTVPHTQSESSSGNQLPVNTSPTGPASFPILKLSANWIMETENPDDYNVTVQWNLQGSINDDYGSVSRYVITVAPEVVPCGGSGRCVVTPAMDEFALREFTFTMRVGQTYSVTIQSDNCNNTQSGIPSTPYNITLQSESFSS